MSEDTVGGKEGYVTVFLLCQTHRVKRILSEQLKTVS